MKKTFWKNNQMKTVLFILILIPSSLLTYIVMKNLSLMLMLDRSPISSNQRVVSLLFGISVLIITIFSVRKWGGKETLDFSYPLTSLKDAIKFIALVSFLSVSMVLGASFMRPFLDRILVYLNQLIF